MEFKFTYVPSKRFYAVEFKAGAFERVPFLSELRFWGMDRTPCPALSTIAALIALGPSKPRHVTLPGVTMGAPVCETIAAQFGTALHPEVLDINARKLLGGEKVVLPRRFRPETAAPWPMSGAEVLTWNSLDDIHGPFGGAIRSNVDAFQLGEAEKNLIIALCASGKQLGHIHAVEGDAGLAAFFHRVGLELLALKTP